MAEVLTGLAAFVNGIGVWIQHSLIGQSYSLNGVDLGTFFLGISILLFAWKFDMLAQYFKVFLWIVAGFICLVAVGVVK